MAANYQKAYSEILENLSAGNMKKGFDSLSVLVNELQIGFYIDRCEELKQNYRLMLNYYIDGVTDPERKTVYNRLVAKMFVLACELREELSFRNSDYYEYQQKRYFPYRLRFSSYPDLFDALQYFYNQSKLITANNTLNDNSSEIKRLRRNFEQLLPDVFAIFWLTARFENKEKELFRQIMDKNYEGWIEKTLVVSALTLNLWRSFDEEKLMLLLDTCVHENQIVKQRALVGLCFVLARYDKFLMYFPAVRNRLVLLADDTHTLENFRNILIQIIATVETDKITKKLREEILPEVMKISPLLKDKLDAENMLKSDEWEEENPEWQDILEKSGVSDKLRELSELQMEGADVYMSTFSLLKNFPFFNEISNWFLPFDTQATVVNELFESDEKSVLSAFVGNNAMCNSDKYSFCLSILQMPEMQRSNLKQSFRMETEQLEEMARDEAVLTPDLASKNISKQYIQDLFRFFRLYPQHNAFADMFNTALTMHGSFLFDILADSSDLKSDIAEYYFLKSHYKQAISLYEELIAEHSPTASLYQKLGYSYQQTSQLDKALDAYLKADIIQPDDLWTLRKIALCYKLSGNYAKALEYYQHLDFLKPGQQNIQLQTGKCLVQLKRFKEALNLYFQLDNGNDPNIKIWRAISWCAFVSNNMAQADYYSQKVLEDAPMEHDFFNAGHIAWCMRKNSLAADLYLRSIKLNNDNFEQFRLNMLQDMPYLIANGLDEDELTLMMDELQFRL
ncbi:MAG: Tetratricopeptide 1 repeat-containing protein [Bacteroidetes bacterium]|nr:Tetratricopeptide 1 repeat-containing protein [Bacteroidota bacterium]